jgi:hypothetical protein
VSYEITGSLGATGHCHCSTCRKSHGAAFATWTSVKPDQFRWTSSVELVEGYESSPGRRGAFARSAAPRLFLPIPARSGRWCWEQSTVIRVCVQANTFSWDPKRPGTRSQMRSHSLRNGPRGWNPDGQALPVAPTHGTLRHSPNNALKPTPESFGGAFGGRVWRWRGLA